MISGSDGSGHDKIESITFNESQAATELQAPLSKNESATSGILSAMLGKRHRGTVGDRIKWIRRNHRPPFTQEQFAERLSRNMRDGSVTRGAIGNWELHKGAKRENLLLISEVFGVSFEWLSTGTGEPFTNPDKSEVLEQFSLLSPDGNFDGMQPGLGGQSGGGARRALHAGGSVGVAPGEIPQVDARLGLGTSNDAEAIQIPLSGGTVMALPIIDTWRIPEGVLRRRFTGSLQRLHIIETKGDSMYPRIREGDFVFVDTGDRTPSPPGIFAIHDGFGHTLKWIEPILKSDPPRLAISAENPKHQRYELPMEDVHIIGRYVCRLTMD